MATRVAYEQNDLEQVEQLVKHGFELVRITGNSRPVPTLNLMLACIHTLRATANDETITALLNHAQTMAHQHAQPRERAEIQAYQLRRWLKRGDLARAQHWAATHPMPPDAAMSHFNHWLLVAHSDLARACICQLNDPTYAVAVEPILIDALATTAAEERWSDHMRLLTVYALLLSDLGRQEESIRALSKALVRGEPEGYLRTFLDEGVSLLPLLGQPAVVQAAPALVARLCALLAPDAPLIPPAPAPAGALSERELEILRLVATGLSVSHLAAHLVISVHTARTHLKNIYAKLDAHTRLQAVERARQQGLL